MTEIKTIQGSMGKGGSQPVEKKDTLISNQTVKTLFAVGEGEIDSVETVYLDTIPIDHFDASITYRTGTETQTVIPNFEDTLEPLEGFNDMNLTRGSSNKVGEEVPNVDDSVTTAITSLVKDKYYRITTVGNSDWYQVGVPANVTPATGIVFKATRAGSGTGVAKRQVRFEPDLHELLIPTDIEAVRLTFSIPVMSKLDGDGNMVGDTVTMGVYVKDLIDGIYYRQHDITKTGKTAHGYTFDLIVQHPYFYAEEFFQENYPTGAWNIKIVRDTRDSPSSKRQNAIHLAAVTKIYFKRLPYPKTALAGVTISDASQFGNRIPEIIFKVKGKKVKYFTGYNPVTRTYPTVWNGTLASTVVNGSTVYLTSWTNNPALILLDMLLDTTAGVGLPLSDVDIISFYSLAKYADDLIPDGNTGTIPRYTLDYSFQQRDDVRTVLSQVLSICNANLITNEFGQISVIYQYPNQNVRRNISNANVVEGSFTYQSSNIEQRTNLVNVTYNNGTNFGRTDTVTVEDTALQERYGLQPYDIVLPGCYHQAQALRKARWALYSNCYFTNFISFSVFLDGMVYKIGDLVRVFDNYNQNSQQGGVLTGYTVVGSTTVLTFDRAIDLTGNYLFYSLTADGIDIKKEVNLTAPSNQITINSVISITPGTIFLFSGTATGTLAGKVYRITSISKDEESIYSITALEFDEAIFTYVDQDITLPVKSGDFADITSFTVPPVSDILFLENFSTNGVYSNSKLQVSWIWDAAGTQKFRARYRVSWSVNDGLPNIIYDLTTDNYDILNPVVGTYTISVTAVHPFTGILSSIYTETYEFRTAPKASLLLPPINARILGTTAVSPQPSTLTFATRDLSLAFDYNPGNQNASVKDAIYDYLVEVYRQSDNVKVSSYSVLPVSGDLTADPIDAELFYTPLNGIFNQFTFDENTNAFGGLADRTFIVKIYSRDAIGDLSAPLTVTCTNPVPAVVNTTDFSVTPDLSSVRIDIKVSSETDAKEYLVWRGTTNTFTADDSSLIYKGTNNSITISTTNANIYWYKVAISDSFGSTGLNISSAKSAASITMDIISYNYSGLQFSFNKSTNVLSWTSFTAVSSAGGNEIINAGSVTWTSGTMYIYYIPGNATLQTTTIASVAVTGRILATYKGGSNLTADAGRAYIDGDQIIAGSLLTNALATNTAYITNMAMIGNILQSDNYIAGSAGWRIDKTGTAEFTGITVRSAALDANSTLGGTSVTTLKGDVSTANSNASTAKNTADAANAAATTANNNAIAATNSANAAQLAATTATNSINDILSDSKISQNEKSAIFTEWKAIYDERADIIAKATTAGVSTTGYTNAYNTLYNYLTGYPIYIDSVPTNGATWCANTTAIAIVGTTFRDNFTSYYNNRQAVLNATAIAAKAIADAANTTANSALAGLTDKLSKSASTILSGGGAIVAGNLTFDTAGNRTGGYGTAITSKGIVGFNSAGSSTFAVDTSGNATFGGALNSATGTFAGQLVVGGTSYNTSSFLNSNVTASTVGLGNVSNLTPVQQASTGLTSGTIITGGGITMSAGGSIKGGKSTFTDTTAGYFLGYTGSAYGFSFGDVTNNISWNGSALTVTGSIIANGNLQTNAITTTKIAANNVTETTDFTITARSIAAPTATASNAVVNTLISSIILPTNDVITSRILLLNLRIDHSDSSPGWIYVNLNGINGVGSYQFNEDIPNRITDSYNMSTHTFVLKVDVPANTTNIGSLTLTLQNGLTSTSWWTGTIAAQGSLTFFTGKR